ncbi:MAG: transcription antitermination factor NusB [Pseudomonadota bacterium]
MSGPPGLAPRLAAARYLHRVLDRGAPLDETPRDDLGPGEAARALRLARETLRHLPRLDHVLGAMLRKTPPPPVHHALRLAAYEILIERGAAYAAVDAAVNAVARDRRHKHLRGLVNAVGRRLGREGEALLTDAPAPALPDWLHAPVAAAFGAEAATAIAAAHARTPPVDLTLRDPGAGADLGGTMLPTGSVRLSGAPQISALPGYDTGAWWVQDAAAAIPVRCLGALEGQSVVDLCAAPGGKTLQLAAAGARVTAVDNSDRRLARLHENLARTGLAAEVVTADALDWAPAAAPDIVVVDAPCSATGTLRRHPDLPHVRPDPDLTPLTELQARLIDRALGWLGPGGRLLYGTCSLLPAEGEDQAAAALARHAGLRVDLTPPPGVPDTWRSAEGGLRLRPDYWPERGGMDGFFVTVLRKPGGSGP